ncbi:MAG TPA: SRPBCC family protein [Candidatus Dojkabacteria bacterium]|jgi:uncharacterized protein YndB with AHSA1/START domain
MEKIKISTTVNVPVEKTWEYYNTPEHVTKWNNASEDWHTPSAVNTLEIGGSFSYRMESKDGKNGFDFEGTYTDLEENKYLSYKMSDGRTVSVNFENKGEKTEVTVEFDPETENPIEMQREGWQAILDNFKKYVESN